MCEVQQIGLYDFLTECDPLLEKLERLNVDDYIEIEGMIVHLNTSNIYEVSKPISEKPYIDEFHEPFTTLEQCYKFICDIFNSLEE